MAQYESRSFGEGMRGAQEPHREMLAPDTEHRIRCSGIGQVSRSNFENFSLSHMLRNKFTLLAICAVFFIAIVCVNQRTGTATSAAANTSANSLFSPTDAPLPERPPQTVRVRLTEVETNADLIDSPLADSTIIIKAGATNIDRKTNKNGVVVFDDVPCGREIVITAKNDVGGPDGVFRRRLTCAKGQVDLGVIEQAFGGKYTLQQRRTQYMGYDPSKNVWRTADGKIVPMRTIRRILDQKQRP
jgi:hypothetical protein